MHVFVVWHQIALLQLVHEVVIIATVHDIAQRINYAVGCNRSVRLLVVRFDHLVRKLQLQPVSH